MVEMCFLDMEEEFDHLLGCSEGMLLEYWICCYWPFSEICTAGNKINSRRKLDSIRAALFHQFCS